MTTRITGPSRKARLAAGFVALVGLAGLLIQFAASLDQTGGSVGAALWAMLRFFTIIGNLLCVLALAAFARGAAAATPRVIGCVTLLMLLIGVVYVTLLRGTLVLSGMAYVADVVMHYVTPVLVTLFWLFFAPKGGLHWGDPARWALLPIAYLPYALGRAAEDGQYAYPFINVDQLGWQQVLLNAAVIALGFLLVGLGLVWLDRRLGRR